MVGLDNVITSRWLAHVRPAALAMFDEGREGLSKTAFELDILILSWIEPVEIQYKSNFVLWRLIRKIAAVFNFFHKKKYIKVSIHIENGDIICSADLI
jgi:hypothetical protein